MSSPYPTALCLFGTAVAGTVQGAGATWWYREARSSVAPGRSRSLYFSSVSAAVTARSLSLSAMVNCACLYKEASQ
jgi:hypothetical protein